jgi:hypothetical protein
MNEWGWVHAAIGGIASVIFLFQTLGSAHSDVNLDSGADSGVSAGNETGDSLSHFLSVRNFVAFFMGYGWVALAGLLSGLSRLAASFCGIVSGIAFVFASLVLIRTFLKFQEDGGVKLENLTGAHASVYIAIGASMSSAGKVMVDTKEGRMELPARTKDAESIRPGQIVTIQGVEDGTLRVTADD